ncbi:MAG: hypothetical protein JO096_08780, partial [Alphaproteobacteria bacterium]|nr:hypothetical protein [Alphaproteobacteria bacterium]
GLLAVASAGLLSGCYYYPYGYYWWGYPYPFPYGWGYPSAAGYGYPPAPGAVPPNPQQPAEGAPQPLNEPVQRAPLPPAPPS